MSKERTFTRRQILQGLAGVGLGVAGALTWGKKALAPPEISAPRVEKGGRPNLPIERYNLPTLVRESDQVIREMEVLQLEIENKDPVWVLEELKNKETGVSLMDTHVGIYYESLGSVEALGIRVISENPNFDIEVGLVFPTGGQEDEAENLDSDLSRNSGWKNVRALKLDQPLVEELMGESNILDLVVVQGLDPHSINDFGLQYANGADMSLSSESQDRALQVVLTVDGASYSGIVSLPQ